MRNHGREITSVAGCQSRLRPNGHSCDSAIRVGLATVPGAVEQVRRLLCIHSFQPDGVGKKPSREGFSGGRDRSAKEFAPRQRTNAHRFAGIEPCDQLCLLRTPRHKSIDQEIGVQVNHAGFGRTNLSTAILDCGLPNRSCRWRQTDLRLQFSEDFQRFRNFVDRIGHGRQTILKPRQKGLLILWRQTSDLGFDPQECAHKVNFPNPSRCVNGGFQWIGITFFDAPRSADEAGHQQPI